MPRPPSIRLRLSRLLAKNMERLEALLEATPGRVFDVKESQMVLNMAKADALIRDRSISKEEASDAEASEQDKERKARELVALIRQQAPVNPAASVSRSGGDNDDDT